MIRQELPVCSPAEEATLKHGTAKLYTALHEELDQQLQKFEQYALETCLHVPAGLMAQTAAAAAEGEAGEVDAAEEAAADETLVRLRAEIAAVRLGLEVAAAPFPSQLRDGQRTNLLSRGKAGRSGRGRQAD